MTSIVRDLFCRQRISPAMTPDEIRTLRRKLDEDVMTFGARFARSPRTVEDWEQGRRVPDAFIQREMQRLVARRPRVVRKPVGGNG
jgi:putative transcriptional regulator